MIYKVKAPILGFNNVNSVILEKADDVIAKISDASNPYITFHLVNPYALRNDYSFEISDDIEQMLEIHKRSIINIYNIFVIQNPIQKSIVNFLSPIIFNEDNGTMGQMVLSQRDYPNFSIQDSLEDYISMDAPSEDDKGLQLA